MAMLGEDSACLSLDKSVDQDVTGILNSTLSNVTPCFNMSVDVKVKGNAVNNLLRAKLKKLNKDTPAYRLGPFVAMSMALLAKGGKL